MNQPRDRRGRIGKIPHAETTVPLQLGVDITLCSDSYATDGGILAIADVSRILGRTNHRLIGGTAVMLHVHRSGLNTTLPERMTADADFGVPPAALRDDSLIGRLAGAGYGRIAGNRWQRVHDERRTATVDLLIPAYTSHLRQNHKVGSTTTSEVPGLAEAFIRPTVSVRVRFVLSDGMEIACDVSLPDPVAMLGLKLGARQVRNEPRDAADIWRCVEVVRAANQVEAFKTDNNAEIMFEQLTLEIGEAGASLAAITLGCSDVEAERRRVRLLAILSALRP